MSEHDLINERRKNPLLDEEKLCELELYNENIDAYIELKRRMFRDDWDEYADEWSRYN
jgi:hypothetical protein